MGKLKFPRPEKTDFPSVTRKERKLDGISQTSGSDKRQTRGLHLLKSGNILITFVHLDRDDFTVKSYLRIYKIPKLELVEEYIYEKGDIEDDGILYCIDSAFSITRRKYIFYS